MLGSYATIEADGQVFEGYVDSIQTVDNFLYSQGTNVNSYPDWDQVNPGWKNGWILTIELTQPARICSLAAYEAFLKKEISDVEISVEVAKALYERTCKLTDRVSAPFNAFKIKNWQQRCNKQEKVVLDILAERDYQDKKWGGKSFDDNHTEQQWCHWIDEYTNGWGRAEGYDFRKRMIKAAALCLAAVEAYDRRTESGTTPAS